jgi:3-methylcrotonyl-CoA carboxylase alpha subunit
MRKVERAEDFNAALDACRREARAAFGEDGVLVEKFIESPRHIEIQVLADAHGNCVHLFERDCSLQRRHQKVIEEAPAPGMTEAMRAAMGRAAVAGAKAVGYTGVGTMEFIVPGGRPLAPDGFYFMEMNTRLQVEHPVTEAITGLDLVEWQFRVASGEPLGFSQADLKITGHAVEARLYAEDPARGFLPQTGRLYRLAWPPPRPGLRIDTGVEEGGEITAHYDPMIAKVIFHAADRAAAIDGLAAALRETVVLGLRTNQSFLSALTRHAGFRAGQVSTELIAKDLERLAPPALDATVQQRAASAWKQAETPEGDGPWSALGDWSLSGTARVSHLRIAIDGEPVVVRLAASGAFTDPAIRDPESGALHVSIDGRHITVTADDGLTRKSAAGGGNAELRAPMPGRVLRILKRHGDQVEAGDALIVLEAMKMEHSLRAGIDGELQLLGAAEGAQVKEGDVLARIKSTSPFMGEVDV